VKCRPRRLRSRHPAQSAQRQGDPAGPWCPRLGLAGCVLRRRSWPAVRRAPAFKTATSDGRLDFSAPGRDAFAGTITRNLVIPADGYYVLGVATKDKARVSIAGNALFEQDGSKGTPHEAFVEPLQHGIYPVRVDFLHATKGSQLQFFVFQVKDGEPEWWKNQLVKLASAP
jgi:hypothetical protein